jgi:hypothetical protein
MRQKTETEVLAEARRHSTGNRQEIEQSKYAECFSCCSDFDAQAIIDWHDEWTTPEKRNRVKRWIAQCPNCGKPTVIGSASGLLQDQGYIPLLKHIFERNRKQRR